MHHWAGTSTLARPRLRSLPPSDCRSFLCSLSYKFIDNSISAGALADLESCRIGPAQPTPRLVGDVTRPAKSLRTKFTHEEDVFLRNWVKDHAAKAGAGTVAGNELYKQLEQMVRKGP